MKKNVSISGYCPVLNDDCSIKVTYIQVHTLNFGGFTKDIFQCEHIKDCPLPDPGKCPLYSNAPHGTPL